MSYFKKKIKIGKFTLSNNSKTFIVAEISANHSQSLKKALKLIHAAKNAGADAIKLQTYKPESLSIKNVNDLKKDKVWGKYKSRYELYKKAYMPWDFHKKLYDEAKKLKMESVKLSDIPFSKSYRGIRNLTAAKLQISGYFSE